MYTGSQFREAKTDQTFMCQLKAMQQHSVPTQAEIKESLTPL